MVWIDRPTPVVVSGKAVRAIDGDSFTLGDEQVRLDGIDAPEYRQSCVDAQDTPWDCGKAARASLAAMLSGPGLKCLSESRDDYGRLIAVCSNDGFPDIGAAQIAAGMAVSDEYWGIQAYPDEEERAREGKKGIWAGKFMRPTEYRAQPD